MTYFTEKQKFTDWGLGVTFILLGLPILFLIIWPLVAKNPPVFAVFGTMLFSITIIAIIYFLPSLKTSISNKGIYLTFKPFTNKIITWQEIEEAEVIKYGFVGYGWRLSFKYGGVYNVKGNKGLRIKLKNNKKLLIGTQKEEELKKAIEELKKVKLMQSKI